MISRDLKAVQSGLRDAGVLLRNMQDMGVEPLGDGSLGKDHSIWVHFKNKLYDVYNVTICKEHHRTSEGFNNVVVSEFEMLFIYSAFRCNTSLIYMVPLWVFFYRAVGWIANIVKDD